MTNYIPNLITEFHGVNLRLAAAAQELWNMNLSNRMDKVIEILKGHSMEERFYVFNKLYFLSSIDNDEICEMPWIYDTKPVWEYINSHDSLDMLDLDETAQQEWKLLKPCFEDNDDMYNEIISNSNDYEFDTTYGHIPNTQNIVFYKFLERYHPELLEGLDVCPFDGEEIVIAVDQFRNHEEYKDLHEQRMKIVKAEHEEYCKHMREYEKWQEEEHQIYNQAMKEYKERQEA